MKSVMIFLLIAGISTSAVAAGDAAAGKNKVAACAGCHGVAGKALVPTYPNLAGQNAPYLAGVLKAYKTQERKGYQANVMYGLAAGLSDQDIEDIAAFYSSEK